MLRHLQNKAFLHRGNNGWPMGNTSKDNVCTHNKAQPLFLYGQSPNKGITTRVPTTNVETLETLEIPKVRSPRPRK